MRLRVLCDEHVELRTTATLEARGIEATHVLDRPGAGATDEVIAAQARRTDAVILTNDDDFLDSTRFPDVTVFYYPENHLVANRLAERVEAVLELVTDPADLPDRLFLTAEFEGSGD